MFKITNIKYMKKILIIFTLFFVSIQNLTASTFPPGTIISSNETITQDWITNHPAPWEIQGDGVIVTFGENLNLNNSNHYFVINGTNVTIDGANKIVTLNGISNFSGLVNATSSDASSALIKNIGVETTPGTSLTTNSGYISGGFNRAEIRNCYSTGVISGIGTGGIVGIGSYGNISNCFSTGDISDINSGGIASYTYDGIISNCFSTGDISGTNSGGIVGYGAYSTDIQNCYSSGNISGTGAAAIAPPKSWSGSVTNSGNSIGWNNTDADRYLTGEDGTIWNTSNTPYTLMSFLISPILSVSLPNATLTTCLGSSSLHTTFDVTGSVLTASVTISAPSNFEISTSSGGTYSSSLTLTNTSTVSQTLYVRLNSSASVGDKTGTITATSTGASDVTTTVSGTILANPTLSTYAIIICKEATYLITKTTDMSLNGSWAVSGTITVNNGYVTAGTNAGNYVVSYTDGCATVSATVAVGDSDISPAITGEASYKINNTNPIPQGPTASLYVGYNGYNYFSATKPTNTGYYKANNQSGTSAGCPYPFYIFRCTTCPDPIELY